MVYPPGVPRVVFSTMRSASPTRPFYESFILKIVVPARSPLGKKVELSERSISFSCIRTSNVIERKPVKSLARKAVRCDLWFCLGAEAAAPGRFI